LRGDAIEGHDQAAILLGHLRQSVSVLALMARQQGQIDVLMKVAHMGRRDVDGGAQIGMNLRVGGVVLLAPPANANHHIVAIGGAGKRDALGLGRDQAQLGALTRVMATATWSAGHREDAPQGLHGLIPGQIVAQFEKVTAVGTGEELGLIKGALLGV
jgi:hypothetical protein